MVYITCKKDNYEILSNTVPREYPQVMRVLVFFKPSSTQSKIKAAFISKHAFKAMLERDVADKNNCHLAYFVSNKEENAFSSENLSRGRKF